VDDGVIGRVLLTLFNLVMLGFLMAPLLLVLWMSLSPGGIFEIGIYLPSLRWYAEVLRSPEWMGALWLSARLAFTAAAAATILGFISAYGLARFDFPGRGAISALFASPLVVPVVTFAIALLQFVNRIGLYDSMTSLVGAHLVLTAPLTVRVLYVAISSIDRRLELAAMVLGANGWRTLRFVTLPLALMGIATAFVFAFMVSFDEVTVTVFVTGPTHQTLPVQIFGYLQNELDPSVTAISGLLIALVLAGMLLVERTLGFRRMLTEDVKAKL
jgi:putative spermidine/putrescine transport system permease protein